MERTEKFIEHLERWTIVAVDAVVVIMSFSTVIHFLHRNIMYNDSKGASQR